MLVQYKCIKGKPVERQGRKAWSPEKDSSAATNTLGSFFIVFDMFDSFQKKKSQSC